MRRFLFTSFVCCRVALVVVYYVCVLKFIIEMASTMVVLCLHFCSPLFTLSTSYQCSIFHKLFVALGRNYCISEGVENAHPEDAWRQPSLPTAAAADTCDNNIANELCQFDQNSAGVTSFVLSFVALSLILHKNWWWWKRSLPIKSADTFSSAAYKWSWGIFMFFTAENNKRVLNVLIIYWY